MKRLEHDALERHQIWIAFAGLIAGGSAGLFFPGIHTVFELLVYPALAILLTSMFLQIPFGRFGGALTDRRYLVATLTTNFVVVPVVVWLLAHLAPQQPAVLLGLYLVLLAPCIDYVIVFTRLGGGDERIVLGSTPVLLVAQVLLLPGYLWLFLAESARNIIDLKPFLEAFAFLIALPLGITLALQYLSLRYPVLGRVTDVARWLPAPMLALTLLVIVGSQIVRVRSAFLDLAGIVPLYLAYQVTIGLLGPLIARAFKLDPPRGRALVFSALTRNSLVVLPLALALPREHSLAALVIVTQTLVELTGLLAAVRIVPRLLPACPFSASRTWRK
uniref:Arsenic resistance protein n=1 Tax=Thermomicrobium roseum TaxID=500 RepID=A0A7C2B6L3_THERO